MARVPVFRITIGGTVIGGTANSVLYIDSNGKLAQHTNEFTYDGTSTLGVNVLQLDTGYTETGSESMGQLWWNQDEFTVNVKVNTDVTGQIFEEEFFDAKNQTGADIADGTFVMFAGTVGASGKILIQKGIADGTFLPEYTVGVTTQSIDDGADGKVTWRGKVRGIDTTGTPAGETWNDGDLLYASPTTAGQLTNVAPEAPNRRITVAAVIKAHTNGTILVRPSWHPKTTELDDVNGTALTTSGQFMVWDQANSYFDPTYNITDYALLTDVHWSRDAGNGYVYPKTLTDKVGIGTNSPVAPLEVVSPDGGPNNGWQLTLDAENSTPGLSYLPIDFVVPTAGLIGQFLATASNYSSSVNIPAGSLALLAEGGGDLCLISGNANGEIRFNTGGYGTTDESMRINFNNTVSIGTVNNAAYLNVQPVIGSVVGQIIKGAAGQTGNLQEWQNSSGTVLDKITADGDAQFGNTATSVVSVGATAPTTNTVNQFFLGYGAFTSQQVAGGEMSFGYNFYYNSGFKRRAADDVSLFRMYDGQTFIQNAASGAADSAFTPITRLYVQADGYVGLGYNITSPTAMLDIRTNQTTDIGQVILLASGQTANAFEVQNSSGTALSGIDGNGKLGVGTASIPDLNTGFGGSTQNPMVWVKNDGVNGTLPSIVIEATNGTGAIQFVDGTQTPQAEIGLSTAAYWFVNRGGLPMKFQANQHFFGSSSVDDVLYVDSLNKKVGLNTSALTNSDSTGQLDILVRASVYPGIRVVAASGQTADLVKLQNNSGTTLTGVNSSGGRYGKQAVNVQAGNYTLLVSDSVVVFTATATATLPAATGSGQTYRIIARSATVTIDGNGTDTVKGELTQSISGIEDLIITDTASGIWE